MSINVHNIASKQNTAIKDGFISLLPTYIPPRILLMGTGLPCHAKQISSKSIDYILKKIKRNTWQEGLYVQEKNLKKIPRYKNADGSYKNEFDKKIFFSWVQSIEDNTALCEMDNKRVGKGVFVPPGKKLPQDTFIPSSGIIKLAPTIEELETKINCSALHDLDSSDKRIIGLIDPEKKGGILNFINHAPDQAELSNFVLRNPLYKKMIATSNLRSTIKFYNGYAIMGLEAPEDICGGKFGKQLLWSYARSCEYLENKQFKSSGKRLYLFNNDDKHNGEIIDPCHYVFRVIEIFIEVGKLIPIKVASLTRWEIMEKNPDAYLITSSGDSATFTQFEHKQTFIPYKLLQKQLQLNTKAARIIIQTTSLKNRVMIES